MVEQAVDQKTLSPPSPLEEWYALEAVLPSADHVVRLATAAPSAEVVLTDEQWQAVASIGGGVAVGLVLDRLAGDQLEAMRLLKGLVDRGLVEVIDPDVPLPPAGGRRASPPARPGSPILVARAAVPAARPPSDPVLDARLAALADQFDLLYAQVAGAEGANPRPEPRGGLFAKRRHRNP